MMYSTNWMNFRCNKFIEKRQTPKESEMCFHLYDVVKDPKVYELQEDLW